MSSQGVMSSKQADNNPGLCPIKVQKSGPYSQIRARDQFSSLSLCTAGATPQCQMLFLHPALRHLVSISATCFCRDRSCSGKSLQYSDKQTKIYSHFICMQPLNLVKIYLVIIINLFYIARQP